MRAVCAQARYGRKENATRGKKYDGELRERAISLRAIGKTLGEIESELSVPKSTVRGWLKNIEKEDGDDAEFLKKKRQEQKDKFVERAWETIENAQLLLSRRVERALQKEDDFDELMDKILDADVNDDRKKAAVLKLAKMRCDDIGKLASVIGTMYDKQALVMKEPTEIVGGGLKFEDL